MLATRDPAPDLEKILAFFHRPRRRRVIRTQGTDLRERAPQLLLLSRRTQRRSAFASAPMVSCRGQSAKDNADRFPPVTSMPRVRASGDEIFTARPQLRWTICRRHPVSCARSTACLIASNSASMGRDSRKSRTLVLPAEHFSSSVAESIPVTRHGPQPGDQAPPSVSFLRARSKSSRAGNHRCRCRT